MQNLYGKVAAVTGAASGIGRSLAINLAAEGCSLAMADLNGEGLAGTAGMLQEKNVKVTTHIVDVSDREQVYDFAEDVFNQHGKVNIIINYISGKPHSYPFLNLAGADRSNGAACLG